MGDLRDLLGGSTGTTDGDPVERTAYGRVTKEPATEDDALTVVIESYSGQDSFVVPAGHWAPRGDLLPIVGTRCLVTFDDRDDAWVPVWSHLGGTDG
ncbi:MAG: hypothetical protein JWM47_4545 [Acidimicrobiales bacterium]|nr:hypothetical protein [Acidimicrobiales bacterium]